MTIRLSVEQVRWLRMHAQQLLPESAATNVAQVIHALCALQSQELPSAALAIRARSHALTAEDVRQAREADRSVVLTWTMRGTMHLVASKDLRWQLDLLGTAQIRKTERRYKQLGLDENTRQRALQLIRETLTGDRALTRAELAAVLGSQGIPVEGQAIHHLVRYAALSGVICFGPEKEGELTYVLLEDWLHSDQIPVPNEAQIYAEIIRRYLKAYAPATLHDLARWADISTAQARRGFKLIFDELVEVATPSGSMWLLREQLDLLETMQAETTVKFLPRYDNYLLGYQSRHFMVETRFANEIHPGGGLIRSTLILNGQAIATWRAQQKRNSTRIIVQPFETINSTALTYLEAEVWDIGRFLNLNTELVIEKA